MGLYKTKYYEKDRKGKWILTKEKIEKAPHDIGRWKQNNVIEKKSSFEDETYLIIKPTKGGLNQKVVRITTYLDNKESKVVRDLITTSNKIPKSKR